jgi:hypothetical protein
LAAFAKDHHQVCNWGKIAHPTVTTLPAHPTQVPQAGWVTHMDSEEPKNNYGFFAEKLSVLVT